MLKHSTITQERLMRLAERYLPSAIYGASLPLAVSAHHVHGEPITAQEAYRRSYEPFTVGQAWGGAWDTTWFHFQGTVPTEWTGQEVVARLDLGYRGGTGFGAEGLIWQGDAPRQGVSPNHADFPVARSASGAETVDFYVEAAANPSASTYQSGSLLMPDFDGPPLLTLAKAELACFRRNVYDFYLDFTILYQLMKELPQDEPRANEIMVALNQAANLLDLHDIAGTVDAAHGPLAAALSRHNGSTVHRLSAVGHAHIDTAWLWPLRETMRKCARTFSTAVTLMDEYPDYRFVCSQPQQYAWVKEQYPALWKRIKQKVEAGQFEPTGSMWIEADCNLSSGESLVRQIVHGKRFFMEEFGYETHDVWLPDVFGYAASLPQIMAKAGIDYFLTQKISWNQFNKFPHHTFLWEGIDGTRIFTHFPPADTYNGSFAMRELLYNQHNFKEHGRARRSLYLYGYGDGGGGPTREMVEIARRLTDLEGMPPVTLERASEFFPKARADASDLPVWVGELYLELHRGTYTTQAHNKRSNRMCELLLRDVEFLAVVRPAPWDAYPAADLDRAWKLVLLNQFHDIIPGSSIHWVYEDSARDYSQVEEIGHRAARQAEQALVEAVDTHDSHDPVVLINTNTHPRYEVVTVALSGGALPNFAVSADHVAPLQISAGGDTAHFMARVPSAGYTSYDLRRTDGKPGVEESGQPIQREGISGTVWVTDNSLENALLRVTWDQDGLLTSVHDKRAGREVLDRGARGNLFQLHEDYPNHWAAWDVDLPYREQFKDLTALANLDVVERGPVRACVRLVRKFGSSTITQDMILSADSPRLVFATEVDWYEDHKFLKVAFPVAVHSNRATYEIQYGHVERPTHSNTSWDLARFEVCAQKWVDLSESGYGVALLNDCKYGHDIWGNVIRLSLLRAPDAPDPVADRGHHRFCYALLPHSGDLRAGKVIEQAYDFNVPVRTVPTSVHSGTLPAQQSFFSLDREGVMIEAIKRAETEDALIVRLYEAYGSRGPVRLQTSLPVQRAVLVDLLERDQEPVALNEGTVTLEVTPFEIVTLKYYLG